MNSSTRGDDAPLVQKVSAVLWPSFLWAGVATAVFFSLFDPVALLECEGEPPLTRTSAYSLGFFMFWLLCSASSFSTGYFLRTDITKRSPTTTGT